jgi:hypothetical protein
VGTITHGGAVVGLAGVNALGEEGSVAISFSKALTGNQALGTVGSVIAVYWAIIDDSQTPNWQNISNPQTPGWALINDTQTPNWEEVVT